MPVKDYYKVLGVDKNASQDEIKSAYRKLAKQYHPDLHPGDTAAAEKFKEVNEAYSVVGDAEKRAKYDRGEMDMDGGGYNAFRGGGGFTATGFDDIFDMFTDMFSFGGGSSRRRAQQQNSVGSDITYTVELTFMESILGCKKPISFTRVERCATCGGTGAKDDEHYKVCDKCGGSGQVRRVQNTIFGQQVSIGACDKCHGSGHIITENCKACGGRGVINKNKIINVSIPAGVENGAVLSLAGEGNAPKGRSGRNGNLLLVISIKPSKVFKRDNLNLYVTVPVSFSTAVCGGQIEIPAPDGVFIHNLAEGTANGETLRFRNKGIHTARGATGDLFVTIDVEVPKGVTRSQKKALEDFERDCTMRNYGKRKAYLDEISKLYK
ncbi:MAG: molecular chaperone DnaJ [Clostridiales bacterium]|nr:molecular chaperone DnaJ [Clostridiales bacterium]